jgi:maleylacetate reductase
MYAPDASPITVLVAEEGIRALADGLPRCVAAPGDLAARSDVLYGAWLAGWALGGATMGLHHKLCHVLGGLFDLPHAATHSVVLPYAVAYSRGSPQLSRIAAALGVDDAAIGIWELGRRLGTPASLAAVGMPHDGVDAVVAAILAKPPVNPRQVEREALLTLLRSALSGDRPEEPATPKENR